MAKDPAVLFYTSDFLTGTSFFTYEQKGQYITLLCQQHQLFTIPKNHMISVCGSLDSPVIAKFVQDSDGNYYNERMRFEAIKRANYCESRRNPGSGRPKKKNHMKTVRKPYENHTENENDNENDNNIYSPLFEKFWNAYPKKKSKGNAFKAWKKIKGRPPIEQLVEVIGAHKKTWDWKKDDGQFIPYPATWLNDRGWEDEIERTDKGRTDLFLGDLSKEN